MRAYLEHLRVAEKKSPRSLNVFAAALAFLFSETLGRRAEIGRIPRHSVHPRPPVVLGAGEVDTLIAALATQKQRAFVGTLYGAGLRISEAAARHIKDIDSARMQLHVREAKGGGERYVPPSARLLAELRGG